MTGIETRVVRPGEGLPSENPPKPLPTPARPRTPAMRVARMRSCCTCERFEDSDGWWQVWGVVAGALAHLLEDAEPVCRPGTWVDADTLRVLVAHLAESYDEAVHVLVETGYDEPSDGS